MLGAAAAIVALCSGCGSDEPEFDKEDFNALIVERALMHGGSLHWTPTTIGDLMPGSRAAAAAFDDGPITDTVVVGGSASVSKEYGVVTTTSDELVDFDNPRAQDAYLKVELSDVADKDKWEIVRDGLADMEEIVVFLVDAEQPDGYHITFGLNWISEVDSDGFAAFPGVDEGKSLRGGATLDQIEDACPAG